MALIPAGFFIMGSNGHGEDEAPEHRVYLDSYAIDRFEVSAENFAAFLNEVNNVKGYYHDNKYGTLYFDNQFHARKGFEDYPINNVKWAGADAYCQSKGKRLPTEAEWEKAARGTDGRVFPWGSIPPNPELSRFRQVWTEESKHNVMVHVKALPKGVSPYGVFNMAGNVKEWVDDWYDREYYKDPSNHINPKGQIGGEFKVLKGGSWRDLRGFVYSSFRNNSYPNTRLDDYGFRCAKSMENEEGAKQLTRAVNPSQRGHKSIS
jgi:formylglycine-generating enzyme required for sulfatase activity